MAALKYWVWLTALPGLSNRSRLLLLERYGSPEDVYYADPEELAQVLLLAQSTMSATLPPGRLGLVRDGDDGCAGESCAYCSSFTVRLE